MKTGVLLGKLKRLDIVQQENEKPRFLYPKNRWLAWDPQSKNLLIVKYKKRVHKHLPKQIQHLHKKFHNHDPHPQAVLVEVPDLKQQTQQIGYLKALIYEVPSLIRSPSKNRYLWHHTFGDTGHKGGNYSLRVMPALLKTKNNEYIIKRRPGNIYKVDDWIRG